MKEPRNFLFWAIGVLGGASILMALLVLLVLNHERRQLKDYRAFLRENGESLSVADLIPPKPSEQENGATDLIAAALELRADKEFERRKKFSTVQSVTPGLAKVTHRLPAAPARYGGDIPWADAAATMAAWDPILERIRQATHAPRLKLNPDFGTGNAVSYQALSAIREASRMLHDQAILSLHEEKISDAVQDTVALLRIIRMLERQPHFYSQGATLSLTGMAQSATWEILQATKLTDSELPPLQDAWQELTPREKLKPFLRMARALAVRDFANIGAEGERPQPVFFGVWELAFRDHDEKETLVDYQDLLEQAPGSEGSWQPFLKTVARIQKKNAGSFSRYYSNSITPLSRGYFASISARESVRALALAAIALRRYEIDHEGAIPSSLAELCPKYLAEVPLDPMDGKPLRYVPKADRTYRLYSVGTDGTDDGGDVSSPAPGDFYYLLDRSEGNISNRKDLVWPAAVSP